MTVTALRTAAEPFGEWRDHLLASPVPCELESDRAEAFAKRQHVLLLGAARVGIAEFTPHRLVRSRRLIRRSDPQMCQILLPLRGTLHARFGRGRTVVCGPDSLYVFNSSRPYTADFEAPGQTDEGDEGDEGDAASPCQHAYVWIPRSLLSLPGKSGEPLDGVQLPRGAGVGALLETVVRQLVADNGAYAPSDAPRLGTVLVDLVGALLAGAHEDEPRPGPEGRRRMLALRIREYIQQHLHDPALTPGTVAAAHHISRSQLYRLFQEEHSTVAEWISLQRLERARRDLSDPALLAVPIHRIAARWGFPHAAAFTRAFRTAYGMPPSDYRQSARVPQVPSDGTQGQGTGKLGQRLGHAASADFEAAAGRTRPEPLPRHARKEEEAV